MWRKVIHVAVLCAAIFSSSSTYAEPLPSIDRMLTQKERSLLSGVAQTDLTSGNVDSAHTLAWLDDLLARDPEPTQFRGYLQMMRATLLLNVARNDEAMAAADESVRLLSGYSAPLFVAFDVYAYSNKPGEGADYLLRASQIDPQLAAQVSDYDLHNIMLRLSAAQDDRRIQDLGDRLLSIGWAGKQLGSRSTLAYAAIKRRVADHDLSGARALIPELVLPSETYSLLSDNRYRDIWPDLERWAGPKLERQWKVYLTEARARFNASQSIENVQTYVEALQSAGNSQQIINDVVPLMSQKFNKESDIDWVFLLPAVAEALASYGRWDDVNRVFDQAAQIWPLGSSANALNVEANHAMYLLQEGRASDALKKIDLVLENSKRWGSEVSNAAVSGMRYVRACALHQLGRDSEAAPSIISVKVQGDPERIIELNRCLGDTHGAVTVLILALQRQETRSDAIDWLQKDANPPCKSVFCERMQAAMMELRSDPSVASTLQKYGRILPYAINEGASFRVDPIRNEQSSVPVI